MGQGGYVTLINASGYTLRRLHATDNGKMNHWRDVWPERIPPATTSGRCYVEYKYLRDGAGSVVYAVDGASSHADDDRPQGGDDALELQLRATPDKCIHVHWLNLARDARFRTLPPGDGGPLGWRQDGTVVAMIAALPAGSAPLPLPRVRCSSARVVQQSTQPEPAGRPSTPAVPAAAAATADVHDTHGVRCEGAFANADWMGRYASWLGHLTIGQLCLLCSHDSGTHDMEHRSLQPWTRTQSMTLFRQLEAGVRVLDLRVAALGQQCTLVLCHEDFETKTSLEAALGQVREFVLRHPTEVVVLDFHRFKNIKGGSLCSPVLERSVARWLGEVVYPCADPGRLPTVAEVQAHPTGRVLVAWNRALATPQPWWPGVPQEWFNVRSVPALERSTAALFAQPRVDADRALHSASVVITIGVAKSVNLRPIQRVDAATNWFVPGTATAANANIVAVDWAFEVGLAGHCIAQSVLKGLQTLPCATAPPATDAA